MLEVRNLTKIYKTKGDVITRALDGVSIKFPDTGMVFLLGKSGSGKSTLLNVSGGLDTPTDGEIIVKGRSSSTFSGSDFDSYRNTYIGFIFQEYNILNEFSVEDNIALALELQGKPKDREKINSLLKQVELESYAKRKPNTLSGGQKQRIAIARALVKDPEIIMADEPTGALDSNTGKQVLDTLKELSKTKLVIVVSHDREFAEIYGDRIIELKDGKVLSDVSKEYLEAKKLGNITLIDDNTISIKKGSELTAEDLAELNSFLKKSDAEILISNSEKGIKEYKEQARISEEGSKENFTQTNEDDYDFKQYSKEDSKLIRSKLPLKHAAKIGASNLKFKPIRLLFTILLSVVSFVLLGVVSTMTFYDKKEATIESLQNSNMEYIPIQKGYTVKYTYDDYSYYNDFKTFLSDDDVEKYKSKYGDNTIFYYNFDSCPTLNQYYYSNGFNIQNTNASSNEFYSTSILGFSYVDSNHPIRQRILAGNYPSNSDEIMITSYTYESMQKIGLRDEKDNKITINSYYDVLNKTVIISSYTGNIKLKIVGVYDVSDLIPEKYLALAEDSTNSGMDSYYWQTERNSGVYTLCLVGNDFYNDNKSKFLSYNEKYFGLYTEEPISLSINPEFLYHEMAKFSDAVVYDISTGSKKTSFNDNDIAITSSLMCEYIHSFFNNNYDLFEKFQGLNKETGMYDLYNYYEDLNTFSSSQTITPDKETGEAIVEIITPEKRMAAWQKINEFFINENIDIFKNITMDQPSYAGSTSVNLCGIAFADHYTIIMSDDLFKNYFFKEEEYKEVIETKYVVDSDSYIVGALVYNTRNHNDLSKLVDEYYQANEDDSKIIINCSIISSLDMVNELVEVMTVAFLWAGIILAVFATLLLFNFISVSITNKKREIGILRAVGARGLDVFKIFFSESFVIVFICCILAIFASNFVCGIINTSMGEGLSGVQLLVFGPKSIILIILLSLGVSLLSTFLPVYSIAKKKPVDSIRAI